MRPPFSRFLLPALAGLLLAMAPAARAAEMDSADAVITRARSYLGTEQALQAVNSIRFTGVFSSQLGDAEPQVGQIELIFQKPFQHRSVITLESGQVETTALDGLESWVLIQDGDRKQLRLLTNAQTRTLRANVWETLEFYREADRNRAQTERVGTETIDGVVCDKIAIRFDANTVRYRYFEQATGRLVLTETDRDRTRELGERVVNGVRFPHQIVTTIRGTDGTARIVTITFDEIVLNERFPEEWFRVPSVTTLR